MKLILMLSVALSLIACAEEDTNTNTGGAPAPVVTSIDCANLPAALESEDPNGQYFYINILDDLSCSNGDFGSYPPTGIQLELEIYLDPESDFRNMQSGSSRPEGEPRLTPVGCSAGEPRENTFGVFGCTNIPENEDVTLTFTDAATETRVVEVVVHFAPPYVAIMSITEK